MTYRLRLVQRDGQMVTYLTCPKCGAEATVDDDQFNGRVSMLCDCGWHETVNLALEPCVFRTTR